MSSNDHSPEIIHALFSIIKKPENYLFTKAVNVFDDRYRINVYSKRYVEGIEGNCISYSCFAKFNSESKQLQIIS